MKFPEEKADSYIERLSGISNSIKTIYNDLSANFDNENEVEKLQEYLTLAIELEDKILNEIGKELLENERFINRLNYLINRSELNHKNDVITRINNYIIERGYLNPFLSTEGNPEEKTLENYVTIKNQAALDYFKSIIMYIDSELENPKQELKRKLTTAKNNLLYNHKMVSIIMKDERYHQVDGRIRCIVFNQNEKLVTDTYKEYAYSIINYCLYSILNKDENILEQIELKSALSLLDKGEIFEVARSYNKATNEDQVFKSLSENNPNHNIIINIIKSFMEKHMEVTNAKK
ncbi:MAG: hypothetical protein HFE81_04025 [Bacilli bacterium]|nr:hypothetical protein [Bacilli bacterium]